MATTYPLRTGAIIEQEWSTRLPNESQPEFQELFDANPDVGIYGGVYRATLAQIAAVKADCLFMLDPYGPNLSKAESRAYWKLLSQCCNIMQCDVPVIGRKAKEAT